MAHPLVSVVIPTYNRTRTLVRAINSCIQQSYDLIEVVVVDDHSPFELNEYLTHSLGDAATKVRCVRNSRNVGPGASRNIGIDNSSGEYICFLDSDDEFSKDKVLLQLAAIEETEADFCYCGWQWVDERSGRVLRTRNVRDGRIHKKKRWGHNVVQDLMVNARCLEDVRFKPYRTFENYDFVIRLFNNYKPTYVSRVLVTCYEHQNERASDLYASNIQVLRDTLSRHEDLIRSEDRQTYWELCVKIGVLSCANGNKLRAIPYFIKALRNLKQSPRTIRHCIKAALS
ncbi:MAG: glycosyltransferase family 2 protein [Acidobacteriota bacterium]|jgi:glycosyltransferase involved in cell wall biosynthesis